MEPQQQQTQNGQELQTTDVNALGAVSALADDHVLAELLRMAPYVSGTAAKMILPYGTDAEYLHDTVAATGSADGSVNIWPFRAIVGSRTAPATDALASWRDIRSGVWVGGKGSWSATPPTALFVSQLIAANVSGQARWDLIYAIISPDASQAAVPRAVKSPVNGSVTTPSVVVQLSTTVTLGYTQGAPSASPILPSLPSDGGGSYYIPLAYVAVPNGFSAISTVLPWQIYTVAPCPIGLSKGLGGVNAGPANQQNAANGQVVNSSSLATWANTVTASVSGRPDTFLPPSMVGAEMLFGAIDLSGANSALWSHQSLTIVDSSRDWRNRFFSTKWQAQQGSGSGGHFAWDHGTGATAFIPTWSPDAVATHPQAGYQFEGFGQSFKQDSLNLPGAPPASCSVAAFVGNSQLTLLGTGVALYVNGSTGNLHIYINGTAANCLLFFWLQASRPYANY